MNPPLVDRLKEASAKQKSSNRYVLAGLIDEARARILELERLQQMEDRVRAMMRSERHDSGWNRHLSYILEGR